MSNSIELVQIGRFDTGIFDENAAEIPAYDPISQRLFVVNGGNETIDVLDLSNPGDPTFLFAIDPTNFDVSPNSVDINNGLVAIAAENDNPQEPGEVLLFDTDGNFLNSTTVGVLPDSLTFTPDGQRIVVANEGEPDEDNPTIDPEGSISIIDVSNGVDNLGIATADFTAFSGQEDELRAQGVRIVPDRTFPEDAEPEFIAVSADSTTAFVTLQENNTVAVVDLAAAEVTELQPLGTQDFSQSVQLDPSDEDGGINLQNLPVQGFFQPDAIATYEVNGELYYVTANEGDARDEDENIEDLILDPDAFPNAAELQQEENLGRLEASSIDGDVDGDGDIDQLFIFGGRSFSIRDRNGNIVFDSGDQFANIIAEQIPELFNSEGTIDTFDERSNDAGSEPEAIEIGEIDGRFYAFIGLERVGGVIVYDITNPTEAQFVQYINPIDEATGNAIDLGPEDLEFISAEDSPNSQPLVAVANAVTGTTTIYQINVPGLLIEGTDDNDLLEGGTGDDTINGAEGNDTIIAGAGNDLIAGGDGNDNIRSGPGNNSVFGGDGNDTIIGGEDNDLIEAGEGNDLLFGLAGSDTLAGGEGNDIFQIDLESGGGSMIIDTEGDELLLITSDASLEVIVEIADSLEIDGDKNIAPDADFSLADLELSNPGQGFIGLGQNDNDLVIDINQDGIIEITNDLTISNFFSSSGVERGDGFIEQINNLSGSSIISFFSGDFEFDDD